MARLPLAVVLAASALVGCTAERPAGPEAVFVAPSLSGPEQTLVMRRCDDGGDGGVLIDGICL